MYYQIVDGRPVITAIRDARRDTRGFDPGADEA
jgi:hypothetical protein